MALIVIVISDATELLTITFNDDINGMYNLDHLQMFVEAVEGGSFTAAGRRLGKVQSAISQGIANLEIDLGVALFDRATRKPRLTADGERLLSFARAVLQQVEDLNGAAQGLAEGEETEIRIVLDDAIMMPSLSRVLADFGEKFRATQIEIYTAVSPDIPRMVATGAADLGLMFSGLVVQKSVEQMFIGHLPFVTVCRPDHPLARLDTVKASDLLPHRQLMLRSPQGTNTDQFPPLSAQVWYADSYQALRELVLQGIGWAYLPQHFVGGAISAGQLSMPKSVFEQKPWRSPVELVVPKKLNTGPATLWLIEELKDLIP